MKQSRLVAFTASVGPLICCAQYASGDYMPDPASDGLIYINYTISQFFVPDWAENSQLDSAEGINSQVADDFVLTNDYMVTGITWSGEFFDAEGSEIVNEWRIIFYADDGGQPTGGNLSDPTSTALHVSTEGFVNAVPEPNQVSDLQRWSTDLSSPVQLQADTTYWIVIQAVMDYPRAWGVAQSSTDQGFASVGSNLLVLGTPFWTGEPFGGGGDMAFNLHGTLLPTPGTLMLLGVAGVVLKRRRRR